jgi:hypothetical protein
MGLAYDITADGLIYRVVDDIQELYRVLIFGTVREDVTGRPLSVPFRVECDRPGLQAKNMDDGLFALSGYPEQIFAGFASTPQSVSITVRAQGYRPRTLSVIIPAGSTAPVEAPDPMLRPLPVRLQGRVMSTAGSLPPIPKARVTSVDDPSPPGPLTEHAVMLRKTLQFSHPVNTPVRARPLTPSGAAKQLMGTPASGDTTVTLTSRTGLGVGNILRFGQGEGARFRTIQSLAPTPANPALPGKVTLSGALGAAYPEGTLVHPMSAGAPGAAAKMTRDADPGDGILMLDTLLLDETVEINAPGALEYVAVGALTGADGYYQVDGVGRTRTLFLLAANAGFQPMPAPVAWAVDYTQPVGIVDFRLTP